MEEMPKEEKTNQSSECGEQEVKKQRIRGLVEQHNLLDDEMVNLIAEEGAIITKNSDNEAAYTRLQEISRREIEVIEKEREIVDAMAHL
jgi:hypothetical protein